MAEETKATDVPKTAKRRWFRFSLRSLMVLVVVLAFPLGWVAKERRQSDRERQIVEQIKNDCQAYVRWTGPYSSWTYEYGTNQEWWQDVAQLVLGNRVDYIEIKNPGQKVLSLIVGLTSLRTLWVESPQIIDFSSFVGMKHLNSLVIRNVKIGDVTPLARLTHLHHLVIINASVNDLSPLHNLPHLKILVVDGNPICDAKQFIGFRNLEALAIGATLVSDITPLAELTNLKCLVIENTSISDLTPLSRLKSLTRLRASGSQISDLSPLIGLQNLEDVSVYQTCIGDDTIEALRNALPRCQIINCAE